MRKIKLEKVTGVVALSYLVLIPVGAAILWTRQEVVSEDVREMYAHNTGKDIGKLPATGSLGGWARRVFGRG